MQQFLLLVSLSAYVSHDLLTLFPNHSSPSVTPMCLAICQDMCLGWSRSSLLSGESHPALPTQSMATSHSSLTSAVKLNTFVQLKSTPFFMLTFLVQYSVNFFWWSPLLNGQIPKLWLSWSPHQIQNPPGVMWALQTWAGGSRALLVLFKNLYFVLNQRP